MRRLDTDLERETGLALADFDVLAQLAKAHGELRITELADRALISIRSEDRNVIHASSFRTSPRRSREAHAFDRRSLRSIERFESCPASSIRSLSKRQRKCLQIAIPAVPIAPRNQPD
jgi:hypothetical protein